MARDPAAVGSCAVFFRFPRPRAADDRSLIFLKNSIVLAMGSNCSGFGDGLLVARGCGVAGVNGARFRFRGVAGWSQCLSTLE